MKQYQPKRIEPKWQKQWMRVNFRPWRAEDFSSRKKLYILDMFPYPSGDGLHVGHIEGYTATDIISRFYRMRGYNVLHPMGWDAFGLPAENYALKMKTNPATFVPKNIARFKKQIQRIGLSYDWSREINTTDPEYYTWTQWIFLRMFHRGLAYEAEAVVHFCPSCKTGLANEEVIDGRCERCSSMTEIRKLKQWYLKITAYADRLLEDLEELDWPAHVKQLQRNWIGKSEGLEIDFPVEGHEVTLRAFTTRPDTLFGVTFLVLSPEHPLALRIASQEHHFMTERYIQNTLARANRGRLEEITATGVFTGGYAVHPLTKARLPIWVSGYVVSGYGTGCVMGVPAHDERDFAFAKKFGIEIKRVISNPDGHGLPYEGEGTLVDSEEFTGMTSAEGVLAINEKLIQSGLAERKTYYKLRDWIFSRQRYWGEPIPIIKCLGCGNVPVPEKELPLTLPKVTSYEPTGTGESPLAKIARWVKVKCPCCGKWARRETNTMPQWAGSCWYYLRYIDPKNKAALCDKRKARYWLPVDLYVGGVEHAVLHLLYARFWHKFLNDIGVVATKEPFQRLVNQGLILGGDHEKMSKSRGNVVNPDEIIESYGADTLRMYEMFMGPLDAVKPWSTEGIVGIQRFLNRVWALSGKNASVQARTRAKSSAGKSAVSKDDGRLLRLTHQTIKRVTEDIEHLRFNTAISALMEYQRELAWWEGIHGERGRGRGERGALNLKGYIETLVLLLAPFAPHVAEEMWQMLGHKRSVQKETWPKWKKKYIKEDKVKMIFQVNGKTRFIQEVPRGISAVKARVLAESLPQIKRFLGSKKPDKVVFVQDRLMNFVVKG